VALTPLHFLQETVHCTPGSGSRTFTAPENSATRASTGGAYNHASRSPGGAHHADARAWHPTCTLGGCRCCNCALALQPDPPKCSPNGRLLSAAWKVQAPGARGWSRYAPAERISNAEISRRKILNGLPPQCHLKNRGGASPSLHDTYSARPYASNTALLARSFQP
jgi:hypothetical protein